MSADIDKYAAARAQLTGLYTETNLDAAERTLDAIGVDFVVSPKLLERAAGLARDIEMMRAAKRVADATGWPWPPRPSV